MQKVNLDDINPGFNNNSDEIENDEPMRINEHNNSRERLTNFNETLGNLSTQMIAKSLIPKVSVLKKALKSADMYVKFERIIEEFNSLMYYNSIIEICTWFVAFLVFLSYPSQMAYIWMHILHLFRGGYGLYLVLKKTPKTYDLIDSISEVHDDQLEEHWGFEKMAKHIRDNFKKYMIDLLSKDKKFYIIYVIITWLNMVFDTIGFLIQLIRFGKKGNEYSDLFMLAVVIIFLYTIFNYAFWVLTFYFRIEPKYRKDTIRAGLGFAEGLKGRIEENYHKAKGKMFPNNQAPNPPLGRNRRSSQPS